MDTVLVPVGDDVYAVPIGWAREVVSIPQLTQLDTAPSMVLGLFNLRGEIVPLLDTSRLLGLGPSGNAGFALLLHTHFGPLALSATALPWRASLDERLAGSDLPGNAGTHRVGRRVAVLLDIPALLDLAAQSAENHPSAVDLLDALPVARV